MVAVAVVSGVGISAAHDAVAAIGVEERRVGRAAAVAGIGIVPVGIAESEADVLCLGPRPGYHGARDGRDKHRNQGRHPASSCVRHDDPRDRGSRLA